MEPDDQQNKTFTVRAASTDEQQSISSDAERMLSLRIPASTLLEVGAFSEFILEPFSGESEVASGVLRKSQDVHEQDDELSLRMEPGSAHIYRQQQQSELFHVGHSVQRITIHSGKEVEALGRKARESLEEEQRKRREIVRLEQDPEDASDNRKSGLAFAQAIRNQRPRPSSTLKRKHTEKFSDAFRETSASAGSVDTWKPNVSHVPQCAEGERSSVIRLHGLPLSVKPKSIRRFFSGLDLERIFVLLPNETRIRPWDERKHPPELLVARHESSFRVFVKFVSSPAADMALARSKEYLYHEGADNKKTGVHIAMTKVPKTIANYLQHHMVSVSTSSDYDSYENVYSRNHRLLTVSMDALFTKPSQKRKLVLVQESQASYGQ